MPIIPSGVEVRYDGQVMITETDSRGRITFVNRKFVEMSGYRREELIGRPHSIIRHPDMPRACFEDMWQTLNSAQSWQGYVKNLRKDGAHYWVVVHIEPKYEGELLSGYIALRKRPDYMTLQRIDPLYEAAVRMEMDGADFRTVREVIAGTSRKNIRMFPEEGLL
jgi:PAS domain S-box-containing protein